MVILLQNIHTISMRDFQLCFLVLCLLSQMFFQHAFFTTNFYLYFMLFFFSFYRFLWIFRFRCNAQQLLGSGFIILNVYQSIMSILNRFFFFIISGALLFEFLFISFNDQTQGLCSC